MKEEYEKFVVDRHAAWERRQLGLPAPWSDNPVVATHKFTNVFRVLDAGTQYIVRELLPGADAHTALWRCFLYRYTNRPEPWAAWRRAFGHHPELDDLNDGSLLLFWQEYHRAGEPIFGSAYKMFCGPENKGMTRLDWAVQLSENVDEVFSDIFFQMKTQAQRAKVLQSIPRCRGFMSMQVLTDIGYSEHVRADEDEFIIPGPGAQVGAKLVDPDKDAESVIREWTERWRGDSRVSLYGRSPSLMDVQNTFCEFGKYARYKPGKTIYQGSGNSPEPVLPAHWSFT